MIKKNLHTAIREYVLEVINDSQVGDLLPTENMIATKFNSSRATVQNVMLALRREGFLERRKGRGSFVSSKERLVFANADSSYKGQILYVYPDYPSMEFILFRKIIEEQARQLQINVVEVRLSRYSNYELVEQLAAQTSQLCGIIMFPSAEKLKREDVKMFQALCVPVVMIGGENSVFDHIYSINPDYFKIGYKGIELLVSAGCRRLTAILNEPEGAGEKLLLAGMKKALSDQDCSPKSLTISSPDIKPWEDSVHAAYLATLELLKADHLPDAIFYRSSSGAVAGLRAIREAGLDVPRDISVVMGDSPLAPLGEYLFPQFTYITCRRETAIRTALKVILDPPGEHPGNIIIDVEINKKESVRKN